MRGQPSVDDRGGLIGRALASGCEDAKMSRHDTRRARSIERKLEVSPAVQRLIDDHVKWAFGQMLSNNYEDQHVLYHYTNLDGLDHILGQRRIRLTGLAKLRQGDRDEVDFGLREAIVAIDAYIESARPKLNQAELALMSEWKSALTLERFGEAFNMFIACFSPHNEDRDMWNTRYGDYGAGVAIGVSSQFFHAEPYRPLPKMGRAFVIQRVVYGASAIHDQVRKALDASLSTMRRAEAAASSTHGPQRSRDLKASVQAVFEQFLGYAAIPMSMVAKQNEFQREREVRGISFAQRRKLQAREEYDYEAIPHDRVVSIFYGPKCDLKALRALLAKHGLPETLLQRAIVP